MRFEATALRLTFLATIALGALIIPSHADDEHVEDYVEGADIAKQQKVHCEVGLSIRKAPNYDSPRVGLLEDGDIVTIAGAKTDDPAIVGVTLLPEATDPQTYWIEIAKPKAGYVLYQGNDSNGLYEYLVPATPSPAENEEPFIEGVNVAKRHKVHCEVGLSIRNAPNYDAPRVGLLEDGDKVTIAGDETDDPKIVWASLLPDAEDSQTLWIEIVKPKRGYVLYNGHDSNGVYEYLVPD